MIVYQVTVWAVLGLVIQVGLPVLIDLVTTEVTKDWVKTLLLSLLTIATTLLTGIQTAHDTGTTYDLGQAALTALGGFILSIAAYYKLWKKNRARPAVQNALVTAKAPDPEPLPPAPALNVVPLFEARKGA